MRQLYGTASAHDDLLCLYVHTYTRIQLVEAAKDASRAPVVILGDVGTRRVDTAGMTVCICMVGVV